MRYCRDWYFSCTSAGYFLKTAYDRIFIKDILNSEFDATFIQFVVRLCHDVNIRVLLEGVETKAEYEKVKTMGLDDIQGYYFGKPMHPEKLEELLR